MKNIYSSDGKTLIKADSKCTKIRLKSGVEIIAPLAFDSCYAEEVFLPEGLKVISKTAFLRAHHLREIEIPDSVIEIGTQAFQFCSELTTIKIPDSVENIGLDAFYACESLTNIHIGGKFNWNYQWTIHNPFGYLKKLENIAISNPNFVFIDGILMSSDQTIVFRCSHSVEHAIIPDSVIEIAAFAFDGCEDLMDIHFPANLQSIGKSAFGNCSSLREICLPNQLEDIAENAFSCCTQLAYIDFSQNITAIGKDAFFGCRSLEFLHIPEKIKDKVNELLANSGYKPFIRSAPRYSRIAQIFKHAIEDLSITDPIITFEDVMNNILAEDCNLVILGKETISGREYVTDYLRSKYTNTLQYERTVEIVLNEKYQRDMLDITIFYPESRQFDKHNILFMLENSNIKNLYLGMITPFSSNHSWECIIDSLRNKIEPQANQLPCPKCGTSSEQLLWIKYKATSAAKEFNGIMSVCLNCEQEVSYEEVSRNIFNNDAMSI